MQRWRWLPAWGRGCLCVLCFNLIGLCAFAAHAAAPPSLLDILRKKGVLTSSEYEQLRQGQAPGTKQTAPQPNEQLLKLLRRKGVLTDEEYRSLAGGGAPAAVVKAAPHVLPVMYKKGIIFQPAGANFDLKINGRIAVHSFFFEPGTTQNDSVFVDRARLAVTGHFFHAFTARLQNEFGSSNGLRDAYVRFDAFPWARLTLGQFKVPFSHEALESKRYIPLVERAGVVLSSVSPSRDVGLLLDGTVLGGLVQYQLAGLNGTGQNRKDNNSAKDIAARLVLQPLAHTGSDLGLSIGGAATFGNEPEHKGVKGRTPSGFDFFEPVDVRGDRLRVNGFAALYTGPYSVATEFIHTREERDGLAADGNDLPDVESNGGYLTATWLLTGERKQYSTRLVPKRPFLGPDGLGPGAWELAARSEVSDFDAGGEPVGNRFHALTLGLNWYPNEYTRIMLDYVYSHFDRRAGAPNPNKHSNNAVLSRFQLEF